MALILVFTIVLILFIVSMSHETGSSPKHVFMYLLLIAMLYVSVISFIALIFQYINILFPDPIRLYFPGIYDTIRFSSSALIVAFPVYLLMSWLLGKEYRAIPETKQLKTRKWLVYLTLFIAAITIIIDLVQLVHSFYSGELTLPFTLKVLTVLLVAAAVFGYYLSDLQKDIPAKTQKMLAAITSIIILATLIAGGFIAGSPQHQRNVRFDDQRIADLQGIQYQVLDYWQKKDTLPPTLAELEDSLSGYRPPNDPATGESYEYQVKGDLTFILCATFATEQDKDDVKSYRGYAPYPSGEFGGPDNWDHEAGRTCFERTIDPERYALPDKKI